MQLSLTAKNILLNIRYYGLLYILFPWFLLALEKHFFEPPQSTYTVRLFSIVIGLTGVFVQLWAIILFQKIGKGTPIPSLAPKQLVTAGPYKYVRNPINIGELMVLCALSLWFMSIALFAYALLAAVAFHLFIVSYEEPKHKKLFGERYIQYMHKVNRWIPIHIL
jgi:protein-S-isoprenylcysteine O-methyltransferase Ste14